MEQQFIPHDRLKRLQENIGFLDNYKGPEIKGVEYVVGDSLNEIDEELSAELGSLAMINRMREKAINKIMNYKKS